MSRSLLARTICITMAVASQPLLIWADTPAPEVEENHSLESKLITPHKPWGRGYARGPVRALFFVYSGPYGGSWDDPGTRLRDVVELCQRFDLQADAVFFGGSGNRPWQFHGLDLGRKRAERLLESPYHVYIIGGFPLEKLPTKIQYLILEQVVKGAGLVCCDTSPCKYMTAERRIDPLPAALQEALPVLDGKPAAEYVSAYRLKNGRGVWLNYQAHSVTPRHAFSWRALAEYDYWTLLAGRALLWAASREPQLSITSLLGNAPMQLNRTQTASAELTLTSGLTQPLDVTVSLDLRRACDGWTRSLGELRATLPPDRPLRLSAPLPHLRAGDYFVDAIVKSKRGAETFGAQCLTIESDFGVESVNLDQTFVELGETITGKVFLRGSPPPGSVLRIQFRDSYDRVLAQQDIELTPAKADYPIKYQPDAFATILMRVEAVLLQAGEEVDMKDASFTVPKRRHGQFNFVIWDAPSDVLGYYAWRKLQEAGISVALIGSMGGQTAQNPVLRACDASLVPYSTRILDEKDDNGFMKPVCWNDEPAVTEHVRKIVDNQKQLRQQGVFVYSLGDEGVTLGCCVHPACLAAYRRYLATQYGSIDKLNASWGTDYKSFDQVQLLDNKDIMEAAAIKTCFPRWYDRQAFARYNLMQFSARFVKAYRQLDPFALTGFEGTGGFGDDYDAILSINGFYAPYPSIGDDIIRSAAPRQLVRSNWMGYSKTADALSDAAWRMVMKGMDSIWFWMWDGIGEYRGYLSPTLDFWPATAELAEEMRPVRQGLGHLLLQSTVLHSGIAIFYSVPSALACRLENGPEFFSTESTHELWTQLTYELGLDFRYLTSAMLKSGALDPREFKVLLLPMSQAIGPEEAQAIRSFVQAGGTVIADVRPGIYDDHCKPLTPGILDDLFGIRRTGRGKPADVSLQLKATLGDIQLDVNLPKARVDTQIETASGQALSRAGEVPVLIVNNVGAGRAVLLNFQLLAFRGDSPDDPQALATRRLLRALYDAAGAKAPITVTAPDGSPLPLTETRVWQNGDALIFGLLRRMQCVWFNPKSGTIAGPPVAARITLPSPRHVYDLRAGKYLGRITTLDTRLRWGRANFFLALPYQINGLRLSLSPSAPSPGAKLTASLRLGVPRDVSEKYAVWLEITDPDGHRPLWGQKLAILSKGTGEAAFPVAYNDPPGKWRLRATELFSKASAESTWTLP